MPLLSAFWKHRWKAKQWLVSWKWSCFLQAWHTLRSLRLSPYNFDMAFHRLHLRAYQKIDTSPFHHNVQYWQSHWSQGHICSYSSNQATSSNRDLEIFGRLQSRWVRSVSTPFCWALGHNCIQVWLLLQQLQTYWSLAIYHSNVLVAW